MEKRPTRYEAVFNYPNQQHNYAFVAGTREYCQLSMRGTSLDTLLGPATHMYIRRAKSQEWRVNDGYHVTCDTCGEHMFDFELTSHQHEAHGIAAGVAEEEREDE